MVGNYEICFIGSKFKPYLLMRRFGPDAVSDVRPTRVFFISLLYLDLYVLGDESWIS